MNISFATNTMEMMSVAAADVEADRGADREETKAGEKDEENEEEEEEEGEGDESQVYLLHPRFESLSIRSEFSAKELEGADGPRLLRMAFLLFTIQVAWFFCLVALFCLGMLSFFLMGADNASDHAAGVFTFALLSQIIVLCLFAGGLHIAIKGVAKRDPKCCCCCTYLQIYRYANGLAVAVVAALCVTSALAIVRGVKREDTRVGTLLVIVQIGALIAKAATVAVAVVVASRARSAFLGFQRAKKRPAPAGRRAYSGDGKVRIGKRVKELI